MAGLNLATANVEVCDQGTNDLHWRPVGAPRDCIKVDYYGACVLCHPGTALLQDGTCLPPAEMVHMELDGEEVNLASMIRFHDRVTFNSIPVSGRLLFLRALLAASLACVSLIFLPWPLARPTAT